MRSAPFSNTGYCVSFMTSLICKYTMYTQWPWVSSQNWLMLRRLQNFKYTLKSNNLKNKWCSLPHIFYNILLVHYEPKDIRFARKSCYSKVRHVLYLNHPWLLKYLQKLLLVIIWIHLYLTMKTTYLVYIFDDTDVCLLCWLTEKQNIHMSFPLIQCHLGGGWGICTPDQKTVIMETFRKKA